MRNYFIASALLASASIPLLAMAATDFSSFGALINAFTTNVVKALGYLAMSLALVAFFFGIVQFIWASKEGKEDAMTRGKTFMVWGLVALFVMFSVWGIIKFVQNMLGPDFSRTEITLPSLNIGGGGGGGGSGSGCTSNSDCPSGQVCELTSRICRPDPGANGPF